MSREEETPSVGRRSLLGAAAAALSAGAMGRGRSSPKHRAETLKGEKNHSASNPGPDQQGACRHRIPNSNEPPVTDRGVISSDLVFLRSHPSANTGRRMDQAGHRPGTSVVAGSGGRHDAAHGGKLSRIALAHGQRMGLHALWKCQGDDLQPGRRHDFHRRRRGRRSLVLPDRLPAFDSRPRTGWLRIPSRLR